MSSATDCADNVITEPVDGGTQNVKENKKEDEQPELVVQEEEEATVFIQSSLNEHEGNMIAQDSLHFVDIKTEPDIDHYVHEEVVGDVENGENSSEFVISNGNTTARMEEEEEDDEDQDTYVLSYQNPDNELNNTEQYVEVRSENRNDQKYVNTPMEMSVAYDLANLSQGHLPSGNFASRRLSKEGGENVYLYNSSSGTNDERRSGIYLEGDRHQSFNRRRTTKMLPINHHSVANHQPYEKPRMSYAAMIAQVIGESEQGRLTLSEIYQAISARYSYYSMEHKSWQNAIRHNLSLNHSFIKMPRPTSEGRGNYWTIDNSVATLGRSSLKGVRYYRVARPSTPSSRSSVDDTSSVFSATSRIKCNSNNSVYGNSAILRQNNTATPLRTLSCSSGGIVSCKPTFVTCSNNRYIRSNSTSKAKFPSLSSPLTFSLANQAGTKFRSSGDISIRKSEIETSE